MRPAESRFKRDHSAGRFSLVLRCREVARHLANFVARHLLKIQQLSSSGFPVTIQTAAGQPDGVGRVSPDASTNPCFTSQIRRGRSEFPGSSSARSISESVAPSVSHDIR